MDRRDFLIAVVTLRQLGRVLEDEVDLIEVNSYYRRPTLTQGEELIFTQVIFWELRGEIYVVREWRIVHSPQILPRRQSGKWICRWKDKAGHKRCVTSDSLIQTGTYYDRELENREVVPTEQRRPLSK